MSRILRGAIVIISSVMFINFLFTAGFGVYRTIHAFLVLFGDGEKGKPGLEIVESLDLFLVALVFLILSLSFMKLFYPEFQWFSKISLPWLQIDNFSQLKQITWHAILLTLLITFGTHVLRANGSMDWTLLIIPVSVLLFAASSKLLAH